MPVDMKKKYIIPKIALILAQLDFCVLGESKDLGEENDSGCARNRDGIDPMDSPLYDKSKQRNKGWGSLW